VLSPDERLRKEPIAWRRRERDFTREC
jgi:hypothetical protein